MTEDAQRRPIGDASELGDADDSPGAEWRFGPAISGSMAGRVHALYEDLPSASVPGDADRELRRLRIDLERAADVSLDLFDRALALLRRVEVPASGGQGVGDEIVVEAHPGERVIGEIWLHNVSDARQAPPQLRCGTVADFDGAVIPPECIRIECGGQPIDGRNSRRVGLVVAVPEGTPAGTYAGLLMARDPLVSLRVRIEVA
jgi:hypothetical protein